MNTTCNVCGSSSFEEQRIDDIYENPDGKKFVVENIPATVCTVCGERTLSLGNHAPYLCCAGCQRATRKAYPRT